MTPMKILIVDDEPHLRMLIQQTLEELEDDGVELFTASNGEEALETIRKEEPNLVFLDVMMPKKNGFDVCSAVKNELGSEPYPHYFADSQGTGIRSPARPGSGRRSVYDEAVRSGCTDCESPFCARFVDAWRVRICPLSL